MATAAHRAHRGGAAGGHGCGGVREFHLVSSPAGPDQADGHQPRPSVTIRQRSPLAARGRGHGRADHASPAPARLWLRRPIAQPRPGGAQIGLRNRSRFVRSQVAECGCAVRPAAPVVLLRRAGCRNAQAPAATRAVRLRNGVRGWPRCGMWASLRSSDGGCGRQVELPPTDGQPVVGAVVGPTMTSTRASYPHRDRGRGLVVGGRVGSGSPGFLKVSNHTL